MPRPNFNKLTAVDLFSGCGGLSLGLRRAGFRVIGAVETNQVASSTYRMNHIRTSMIEDDVRNIPAGELSTRLQIDKDQLHLIAACPPCQGFSRLRTLNGMRRIEEPQNDLLLSIIPFVEALRPHAVMLENVPRVIHDDRLSTVVEVLERLAYAVSYDIFDAQDYGVPQRRKRMILMATRHRTVTAPLPTNSHRTVRSAIGRLHIPGTGDDPLHDYQVRHSPDVIELIKLVPKNGGSRFDVPANKYELECHRNTDGFKDVYGRISWDKPAPTITGGCINPSKGRFVHPDQNRAITLREAATLQGFPRDYQFDLSKGRYAVAQMIGNAFPPKFAEHHARAIYEHISALSTANA